MDSRLAGEGDQVRRRRECTGCGERFTTYEEAALTLPRVLKHDGTREPFSETKLRAGMLRALEKRPVETERVEAALNRIKRRLAARGEREVASHVVGEWVMDALRQLDQVAYIRFASVYRNFTDASAFRDVVEHLESAPPPAPDEPQLPLLPRDEDEH